MPPKKSSDDAGGASKRATDNDLRFFESYLKNMKVAPDVAWEEVACEMGLAHGGSARERFRQIKQKLGWMGPAATPRGNKRKKATPAAANTAQHDDDDDSPSSERPQKKQRTKSSAAAGRKKKTETLVSPIKEEDGAEDVDDLNIDEKMAGEA